MATWLKDNFWIFFCGLFALVGTVFGIAGAVVWQQGERIVRQGASAEGMVVRYVYGSKGGSAAPVIEYETDWGGRQTYVSSTYTNPPAYKIGQQVRIWYDPAKPEKIVLPGVDRWLLPAIFGGFFVVFGAIGYGGLAVQYFKGRQKKWLLANGQPVEAALLGVSQKTSVRINGASPFVVQCQWLDRARNHVFVFESDYVWYNPTMFLQSRQSLQVLIDPKNPKSYWVDLSFLPETG